MIFVMAVKCEKCRQKFDILRASATLENFVKPKEEINRFLQEIAVKENYRDLTYPTTEKDANR